MRSSDTGSDGRDAEGPADQARQAAAISAGTIASSIREALSAFETAEVDEAGSANEQMLLEEIAQSLLREADADRLAAGVLRRAATLLSLDIVRLYRVDPKGDELALAAGHQSPRLARVPAELGRSLEPFRSSRRHQRGPISIEEILGDEGHDGPGRAYSVLSVPIFFQRELWGVLQAAVLTPRRLKASEARTLEIAAGLLGTGLSRLESVESAATLNSRLVRRNSRILELHRKLRDVRDDLESRNRSHEGALDDLRKMESFREAFLASVSHEMRTPLTIIRSYADLLLNYKPDTREKEIEFLTVIDSETAKLTQHINKILELTEIRANEVQMRLEPHSPLELVRSAVEIAAPAFAERDVRVEVSLPANLPNLLVDRERCLQVLVDLIDNAAKFSAEGESVKVSGQESPGDGFDPFVTLWVTDHGIGIDPEHQARIFEQFSQITDTARGKPRGIGLGLPICKAYVEAMGGRIWIESEVGKGSSFFVTFPATSSPLAP